MGMLQVPLLPVASWNHLRYPQTGEVNSLQNAVMLEKKFKCTHCEQEESQELFRRKKGRMTRSRHDSCNREGSFRVSDERFNF